MVQDRAIFTTAETGRKRIRSIEWCRS